MTPRRLQIAIRNSTLEYARTRGWQVDESEFPRLFLPSVEHSILPQSYAAIRLNPRWSLQLEKPDPRREDCFDIQSCTNGMALALSVFCYPPLSTWPEVCELLGEAPVSPEFGKNVAIPKKGEAAKEDWTEIVTVDVSAGRNHFLVTMAEDGFVRASTPELTRYAGFLEYFCVDGSPRQWYARVVRQLLAAIHLEKHHILLCDERRPDLMQMYFDTVSCLKDYDLRSKCKVVFWQDFIPGCDDVFDSYLRTRYAME